MTHLHVKTGQSLKVLPLILCVGALPLVCEEEKGTLCCGRFAVILLVLWLLGLVTSYTMSGFIYILLLIAIVMVLVRLLQGRRVL